MNSYFRVQKPPKHTKNAVLKVTTCMRFMTALTAPEIKAWKYFHSTENEGITESAPPLQFV
jgi:hypothetical protein